MSDLRVMKIPVNKLGLGVGSWLRWTELRAWLVERDEKEIVEVIEEYLLPESTISTREITVSQ